MRTGILLTALILAAGFAVHAAPPPPAPPLPGLERPIDGYDLRTLYQIWRSWIESRKGAAADASLAEPDRIEGEEVFGQPILRFTRHNDFGHFLSGEIRIYCRPAQPYGFVPGTCHYLLRRAYVPHNADGYGNPDNPVARWMRDSFDTGRLTARLRELGLGPETDWWLVDRRERLFATMPTPAQVLMENATVVRLDSRECSAMARAIEAIDRAAINWRLDLYAVGRDQRMEEPVHHGVRTIFTLPIRTPAGFATIEASGSAIARIIQPVLDAADACERGRAGRR